jgi:hypothetical protein
MAEAKRSNTERYTFKSGMNVSVFFPIAFVKRERKDSRSGAVVALCQSFRMPIDMACRSFLELQNSKGMANNKYVHNINSCRDYLLFLEQQQDISMRSLLMASQKSKLIPSMIFLYLPSEPVILLFEGH